jgi:hypothetical protein
MGEVQDAVEKYGERKDATLCTDEDVLGGMINGDQQLKLFFSGYDLDTEEVMSIAVNWGSNVSLMVLMGELPLVEALKSLWIDGLVTGIILERDRDGD